MTADPAMIEQTLVALHQLGQVLELRILETGHTATVAGYFDDFALLATAAAQWSGRGQGVYTLLNPCDPALLARSPNRLTLRVAKGALSKDGDMCARRWLPIDCDPVRLQGISSTAAEHEAALQRAQTCRVWLRQQGWPEPIAADSGNGAHLLYRVALPNDATSKVLLRHCLKALANRFSDDAVKLDTGMYNAARIWKLYGSLACKGANLPARPHRLARLLEVPTSLAVVSQSQLDALATFVVVPVTPTGPVQRPVPPVGLDDQTLLLKMFAAKNGTDVRRLWEGERTGYTSHSEADLALVSHLAFWTGGDMARIDTLFRQSGLYRDDKWNRVDYRERTITKALEQGTFYDPQHPLRDARPWHTRARVWTGQLPTVAAEEVPPWHA